MRCDGEPVRPGMRTTRRMSRASQPEKQNGTLSADTIRASGLVRPHQQAGHKTAPDQNAKTSNQPLQCGSHPHRTFPSEFEDWRHRGRGWLLTVDGLRLLSAAHAAQRQCVRVHVEQNSWLTSFSKSGRFSAASGLNRPAPFRKRRSDCLSSDLCARSPARGRFCMAQDVTMRLPR